MEYWTMMLITILSGPMEGSQMALLYKSESSCIAALNAVSDTLADQYDHKLDCEVSTTLSASIRPRSRP